MGGVVAIGRSSSSLRSRVAICGVLLDRVDRKSACAAIEGFLESPGLHQIVTVNTDFARLAERDATYRKVLDGADLAVADGMPLVWLSRLMGAGLPERVPGIDLVDDCCRLAARRDIPVFLLGAGPGVAQAASRALATRHSGLRIAGTFTPPFGPSTDDGDAEMVDRIRAAGRCVLFVAFGAPRQDRFIATQLKNLDVPVAMGVGGTFDVLAGAIPRAPRPLQRAGLEWVWRLAQEPGRLWRRYLLQDLPFLVRMGAALLRSDRGGAGA
jgi:N-acetylglucosaminyldiphosphoundecaprenol N-acetyl-beta-D-mannosaminyltransferase